ncbi:exo-alpha-sialidase [Chitinasiproducens palmae]|uniref:exo-alpha-sialidase n=1 Tax=Chitinasiproducens palmae TaxID=1770053 RepID=A0A1H2PQI5_9BURK|nr:sialidase family protein [Chitinasiproducens palmae]SDV49068.1 BNR repeat-like domain-containing protein [Chitinasiproducens palmae]
MADNVRLRDFDPAGAPVAAGKLYADMGAGEVALTLADLLRYLAANGGGVLLSSGAPSAAMGLDGQVAFDPKAGMFYGPKTAGAWPAGMALKLSTDQISAINDARDIASSAADAARATYLLVLGQNGAFSSVDEGLKKTSAGQLFGVLSTTPGASIDIYENVDGAKANKTAKALADQTAVTTTQIDGYLEVSIVDSQLYSAFKSDGTFVIAGYDDVQASLAKGESAAALVAPAVLASERGIQVLSSDGFELARFAPDGTASFAGVQSLQAALESAGPAAVIARAVAQQRTFAKTLDASLPLTACRNDAVALECNADRGYGYRCPVVVRLSRTRVLLFAGRLPNPNPYYGSDKGGDFIGAKVVMLEANMNADGSWAFRTDERGDERVLIDNSGFVSADGMPAGASNMSAILIPSGAHAGRLLLFYATNKDDPSNANTQTTYMMYSDDQGASWSDPRLLTEFQAYDHEVVPASGPKAIQTRFGPVAGRILVPLYGPVNGQFRAFAGYSDDGGDTWHVSGPSQYVATEAAIAEDIDGKLYMSIRGSSATLRYVMVSDDGGLSWTLASDRQTVADPAINGDLLQAAAYLDAPAKLILSNLDAINHNRANPVVRVSYDGGASWPYALHLNDDPTAYAGYSSLDMLDENTFVLARESTPGGTYGSTIVLTKLNIADIKGQTT